MISREVIQDTVADSFNTTCKRLRWDIECRKQLGWESLVEDAAAEASRIMLTEKWLSKIEQRTNEPNGVRVLHYRIAGFILRKRTGKEAKRKKLLRERGYLHGKDNSWEEIELETDRRVELVKAIRNEPEELQSYLLEHFLLGFPIRHYRNMVDANGEKLYWRLIRARSRIRTRVITGA